MEFNSYITGFVDGEGTFSVSFNYRPRIKTRIEVRPSFSISQHKRNKDILFKIREYFGVGGIRFSKRDQNYKYEVRSIKDLTGIIIPYFKKYPLKTKKNHDFRKFEKICRKIDSKHHLNTKHLEEIIELACSMNEAGKRKYSRKKLLTLMAR